MRSRESRLAQGSLKIGRFDIPYARTGHGRRWLIGVNALQQTMAAWRPFMARFSADPDHRLGLFDFPNQGRARIRSGPAEVSLMEQVAVLSSVVDALSPHAPVALIGGSWGSVIAAAFAATRPSRVSTLILGSFRTRPNPELRAIVRQGIDQVDRGDLAGVGTLFVHGFGARMRDASQQRLRDQFLRLSPDQLRQMVLQARMLLDYDDIEEFVDLRRITARTLVVNGGADPIVDAGDAWEAAARIPDCAVRLLPGVGHFLHLERPEIMDVYCDFLAPAQPVASEMALQPAC